MGRDWSIADHQGTIVLGTRVKTRTRFAKGGGGFFFPLAEKVGLSGNFICFFVVITCGLVTHGWTLRCRNWRYDWFASLVCISVVTFGIILQRPNNKKIDRLLYFG